MCVSALHNLINMPSIPSITLYSHHQATPIEKFKHTQCLSHISAQNFRNVIELSGFFLLLQTIRSLSWCTLKRRGDKESRWGLPAPHSAPYISPIEPVVDTTALSSTASVHTSTRTKAEQAGIKEDQTKLIEQPELFDLWSFWQLFFFNCISKIPLSHGFN